MDKKPYLVIVWPPPAEYVGHREEFIRGLLERLNRATSMTPVAVVKSLEFVTLLVEGHIGSISEALHHSRDNQTRYLVVQPQSPVASYGVATADQWIRARSGN